MMKDNDTDSKLSYYKNESLLLSNCVIICSFLIYYFYSYIFILLFRIFKNMSQSHVKITRMVFLLFYFSDLFISLKFRYFSLRDMILLL